MFSTKTIVRFGRSQKLGPDTLECRKLLSTLKRFRFDFEVALIGFIEVFINQIDRKTFSVVSSEEKPITAASKLYPIPTCP
jgi:hypothetical protein